MVVPWVGFPLAVCCSNSNHLQGQVRGVQVPLRSQADAGPALGVLEWPYVEGLRIDEAMHPLTLMVVVSTQGASEPKRAPCV